jgi:hypothetical protein
MNVTQDTTAKWPIVAGATINGIRRIARIDLTIGTPSAGALLAFALVYVPEGITVNDQNLAFSTANNPVSLYTPEQHILTTGTVTSGAHQRYYVPGGRSLASMDTIWLFAKAAGNDNTGLIVFRCSFLVAFA